MGSKQSRSRTVSTEIETLIDVQQLSSVKIHVIVIGQGDAILLETKVGDEHESKFYLIDGGKKSKIARPSLPFSNLESTLEEKGCLRDEQLSLEAIIITHPDEDHHGGINRLLAKYKVDCPVVTTVASEMSRPATLKSKYQEPSDLKFHFPPVGARVYEISQNRTKPKIEKNKALKRFDWNKSSVLVEAGKYVAFTGDSTGELIYQQLKFRDPQERPIVFQVPHHGSKKNCVLDQQAIDNIKGEFMRDLQSISTHPAYEQALFFCTINAKVYFISHGVHGKYNHPNKEVITGILIAATVRKMKCTIVVTHKFSLTKINYPSIGEFSQDWRQYVTIKEPKSDDTRYITIIPKLNGEPEFCNANEWRPEDQPEV